MRATTTIGAMILLSMSVGRADTAVNPSTGNTERAGAQLLPVGYEIFWEEEVSGQWETPVRVTQNYVDDIDARLCFSDSGNTLVFYTRSESTERIYLQIRDVSTGDWSEPALLSSATDDSRHPSCATDSQTIWFAYEVEDSAGYRSVVAGNGDDDDDVECPGPNCPFGTSVIRTTGLTSSPDPQVHVEDGHVWVDWVDSPTAMGRAEFNPTTQAWGPVETETITEDIDTTRVVIRALVLE